MPKSKLFSGIVLCSAIALATNGVVAKPVKTMTFGEPKVVQLSTAHRSQAMPTRDETNGFTFRWFVSNDGATSWSDMRDAGETGMIDTTGGEEVPTFGDANAFGVVADGSNRLHFVAVLDAFLDVAERNNGVYDVRCTANGQENIYTLIAAEGDGMDFVWSDCGINADGDIYAIWVSVDDRGEEAMASIWGAMSEDDGLHWSDPFQIAGNINVGGATEGEMPYPHMTTMVDEDYFYILYQMPNEGGTWDFHSLRVPSSLSGNVLASATGAGFNQFVSFYIGAVNPIAMDITTNHVYFATRSAGPPAGTSIGIWGGEGWNVSELAGAQRYPSVMMDMAREMPYVFSNFGVPPNVPDVVEYHVSWFAFDELGYNGGSWVGPVAMDSVVYAAPRELLYVNQGVTTSTGRLVVGENIWGQFTPEGFKTIYSDDGGENWAGSQRLWSSFDDGDVPMGGFIAMNHLVAGVDNKVFVAFACPLGETDQDGPMIGEPSMPGGVNRNTPFEVRCDLEDLNGIGYTDVNWLWTGDNARPDSLKVGWEFAEADTVFGADALGNGDYRYWMPNDTMQGHVLADGDSVWFFIFAQDQLGNNSLTWESLLIVGQEFQGVKELDLIPVVTELGQNYPNPFNNSTVIPFTLAKPDHVKLQVFDTNGRLVRTLKNGRMHAGRHMATWNTEGLTSGVYIYTLQTRGETFSGKMSLIH